MNGLTAIRECLGNNPPPRERYSDSETRAHPAKDNVRLRQFLGMECAFSRHGGLCSGDEVARRLRVRTDQPLSMLARWIVGRAIVCFAWQGQTFIPMFQFDSSDISIRTDAARIVDELRGVFDSWDLALWFSQPNAWLNDAAPVERILRHPQAVFDAARADRYVSNG